MAGHFNLCTASGRQEFFDAVETDIEDLKNQLSTREFQNIRLVMEIGYNIRGLTRAGKKRASIGTRNFRTLDKLERFLGLKTFRNGMISGGTGGYTEILDWSPAGLCKYRKRAYLAIFRMRGENIVGERVLKRYTIE